MPGWLCCARNIPPAPASTRSARLGAALVQLSVLEEHVTRARQQVEVESRQMAENEPEAEQAAEDEERETEAPKPS